MFSWGGPARLPASAAVGQGQAGSTRAAWRLQQVQLAADAHAPQQQTTSDTSCVASIGPVPTATPTPSPTPTATVGPLATGTVGPTVLPRASPTPTLPTPPIGCIVSAAPSKAFNAIGRSHTFLFLCGNDASLFPGPGGRPYPTTGCFDVQGTVTDLTTGALTAPISATCANQPVPNPGSVNCAPIANPICAAGFLPTGTGGACQPCPAGFTYSPVDVSCHAPPSANGVCPPGSTALRNAAGVIIDCRELPLSPTPRPENEATVTINPGAPHVFRITFTGFIGTSGSGACPPGTRYTPNADLTAPGGPTIMATACAFEVSAEKKYIEATTLSILQEGTCAGTVPTGLIGLVGGSPCFFIIKATGIVILKTGVNCENGSEPATGTSAAAAGFYGDPLTKIVPSYQCTNDTLSVKDVPVPGLSVNISANNGLFGTNCVPNSRAPTPTIPTPTPATPPPPTDTPTAAPTPTVVVLPTATPIGGVPTPTLVPAGQGFTNPAFCQPPGVPTATQVTDQFGLIGFVGTEAEVAARAELNDSIVTVTGTFSIDGVPTDARMFVTLFYPNGVSFCDASVPIAPGTKQCSKQLETYNPLQPIQVQVSFIFNCTEYGANTSFVPPLQGVSGEPAFARLPVQNGLCVLRQGSGPLTISANSASTGNTQPALSAGPTQLGVFGIFTPTPTAGPAPAPTQAPPPTNTPVPPPTPTPTNTPTPRPTPTPTRTPTPTPTSTPVPSPTPVPPLRFSLDAARVANVGNPGNRQGLDAVQPGQRVWLMMYFTINSVPRRLTRTTTYEILRGNIVVFRAPFKATIGPTDVGRFIRYTVYMPPTTLPFGLYTFRATLTIDGQSKRRTWQFALLKRVPRLTANSDTARQ